MLSPECFARRRLPHWFVPTAAHFVTYRLAGTIPAEVFQRLQAEHRARLARPPGPGHTRSQHRELAQKQLFALYDHYLDDAREIRWLAKPAIAAVVRNNLYHHNGSKYHLLAYSVMPNHVHVLLQPCAEVYRPAEGPEQEGGTAIEQPDGTSPLSRIMHSLKSYTAHEANKILKRAGSFWQGESYDHWVRDADELARIVEYIRFNPVKAGLVGNPQDWFFCSAHDRFLQDGSECGWLPQPGDESHG
jgi:putative DNA methylase